MDHGDDGEATVMGAVIDAVAALMGLTIIVVFCVLVLAVVENTFRRR